MKRGPKAVRLGATLAIAGAMTLAACGDSYDRDDAIEEVMSSGVDRDVAVCIVDAVEDEFGIDKLNSSDDLTSEDEDKLTDITFECMGL